MNCIVYTAITKGYDILRPPPDLWKRDAEFVAFLEDSKPAPGWERREIHRRFIDPCRNAKIHKVLPHKYFPDTDYSLWIDGSVQIISTMELKAWVDQFLGQHDLAVFRHPARNCLYKEGIVCMQLGLDSREVINRQMQKYYGKGYPRNNGLAECTVLLRRHTPKVKRFNEAWYAEIKAHSRRDQLSFNYVAHKLGLDYAIFPGTLTDNPFFVRSVHTAKSTVRNSQRLQPAKASRHAENPTLFPKDNNEAVYSVVFGQSRKMKVLFDEMEKNPLIQGRSDGCVRNLLFTLAITCKPSAILEIGAHIGAATLTLGYACKVNKAGKVVTLEPNKRLYAQLVKNIFAARLEKYITPVFGYSDDQVVLDALRKETFQLVFIDAKHTYQVVMGQLETVAPLLAENGFVVLHDSSVAAMKLDKEGGGGVRTAILEFCTKNKNVRAIFFEPPVWGNATGTCLLCKQTIEIGKSD